MSSTENRYTVAKALNNNVILARDDHGREMIMVGRGLGFTKSQGVLEPADERIEKVFFFLGERRDRFMHLLSMMDDELVGACEELIGLASRRFNQELNSRLHIALAEHVAFALQRLELEMELPNPFIDEIRILYPDEFTVAADAVDLLSDRLGVQLPEAEQGFLALHFAAARHGRTVSTVTRQVSLVQEVYAFIMGRLGSDFPGAAITGLRLKAHLRGLIDQLESHRTIVNPLLEAIRSGFPAAFALGSEAGELLSQRLGVPVSADDVGFLAMHIIKVQQMIAR